MTKILLVEDDKSLREIYGVRLQAEGYSIVSAGDGEEALAIAIKERPDLIIIDVMMPKVSGFDMLDILRSTTETKNIKVIVMTALSSEEQRQRGEMLGANRYLVKSQVGIEDVVQVVHEVLQDAPLVPQTADEQLNPTVFLPVTPPPAPTTPATAPTQPTTLSTPPASPPAAPTPVSQPTNTAPPVSTVVQRPPVSVSQPQPVFTPPATPTTPPTRTRTIQPLGDPTKPTFDINELLDKEIAKEAGIPDDQRPPVQSIEQGRQALQQQIDEIATEQQSAENTLEQFPNIPAEAGVTESEVNADPLMQTEPQPADGQTQLQQRGEQPVVQPLQESHNDQGNSLSGTTLPPTSI